jgi:hypothetical protein
MPVSAVRLQACIAQNRRWDPATPEMALEYLADSPELATV